MRIVFIGFCLFVFSCHPTDTTKSPVDRIEDFQSSETLSDSTQIVHQIHSFIKWYRDKYHWVNGVEFTGTDAKGNYKVNLDQCAEFLNRLKSSGFISNEYISVWYKYFESQVQYFKDNPMNEGPPEGFDYDLVFITQEPELLWESPDVLQFTVGLNEDNQMEANLLGELDYSFEMIRENGVWKIAYIGTMNYD